MGILRIGLGKRREVESGSYEKLFGPELVNNLITLYIKVSRGYTPKGKTEKKLQVYQKKKPPVP
jgi:hypothetical protein